MTKASNPRASRQFDIAAKAGSIVETARQNGLVDADGLLLNLTQSSKTMIISCSGIVPDRVIYSMENTSRALPTKMMFVCDRSSLWYHRGIDGLTTDFDETIALIGGIVEHVDVDTVCAVGTSGGGYFAFALALRLGLNRALALGPQTRIDPPWRMRHGDERWAPNMEAIAEAAAPRMPYAIAELIQEARSSGTRMPNLHLIYSAGDELDTKHAEELAAFIEVNRYPLQSSDHNSSAAIHAGGRLQDLLDFFVVDCPEEERRRKILSLVNEVGK